MVTGVPGVAVTLGTIVGLATTGVIRRGGIPVTRLLVLRLVPVMVLKRLVELLLFFSACSSLTCASKKLKSSSVD